MNLPFSSSFVSGSSRANGGAVPTKLPPPGGLRSTAAQINSAQGQLGCGGTQPSRADGSGVQTAKFFRGILPLSPPTDTAVLGFTMVEIALCLAIIGFALVAIIGVLPLGLHTQKDNRAETIINKDGMVLMEAIRSGAHGLDELTNYVDSITISQNGGTPVTNRFINGQDIIGLLSTPKYIPLSRFRYNTNTVTATMRAISGSAVEHLPTAPTRDMAFSYLLRTEIIPFTNSPINSTEQSLLTNVPPNLYELRLRFLWPLLANGTAGEGRKTFRSLVHGQLVRTNMGKNTLYFFQR